MKPHSALSLIIVSFVFALLAPELGLAAPASQLKSKKSQ